jgi:enoyl-CoA hydratase
VTTTIERDGPLAVIRLDEPRGNALSSPTIQALRHALDEVERSDARAVVLTGRGRVFSAGLDLRECVRFDRQALRAYVGAFEGLFERLFSFPLPVVAAVNGSAIAGGAVIALACDVRVMAPAAQIGLNEVQLGIPFPSMAFEIGRFGIPAASHTDGILLGKVFSADEALARGIAAEKADDVVPAAKARAREFTERGGLAVRETRRALRAEALERARVRAPQSREDFVAAFLAEEAQARIRALVEKLEKK